LSGGNQQKVALGKWLSIKPDVLLVNEPTRGVDVGAKSEIYQRMRDLASRGITIIFASTDIQEITYLPDRVITFYRGMMIDEHRLENIKTPTILKEITDPFNETNL
jgi:ABC-type sugar transport system ATPase subunit